MIMTLRLHQTRRSLLLSPSVPLKEARRRNSRRPTFAEKIQDQIDALAVSPGMILAKNPTPLRLSLEHLSRHVCIFASSGSGKSKFLELWMRQIFTTRAPDGGPVGGLVIEPHGDLVKAAVAHLRELGVSENRILYIEPRMDGLCIALDPAADPPLGVCREEYEQWLSSTVDRTVRTVLRNVAAADQEIMVLLERWLKNVFTACLVSLDEKNTHVGLDKAILFTTDPEGAEFSELYDRVRPFLPSEVRSDFDTLRRLKPREREQLLGSTINRLRKVLCSHVIRMTFGQHAPALLFREAIRQGWIILANMAESDSFSRDQGNLVGGNLISMLLSAARQVENEAERRTFFLIIDEAEHYIGEDLRMAFPEMRKFKVPLIISV
jgi:hypothetical protein